MSPKHDEVLLSGELEVRRGGNVVATVGSGDCVGEAAVLTLGRRNASVVARAPVRLGVIEYGANRARASSSGTR